MKGLDPTDIYRIFHPNTEWYTFLAHERSFSITDHIICHKSNLNIYKKIPIMPGILLDHHKLKLNFNNRNTIKLTHSSKLNNSLLHDLWVRDKRKKEINDIPEFSENEGVHTQIYWKLWK